MKCEEVQSRLLEYIDCQLDELSHERIQGHLHSCDSCKQQHDGWQDVLTEIQKSIVDEQHTPEQTTIHKNVMSRIEVYEGRKKAYKKNIRIWNRLATIAAIFAVMFMGYAGINNIYVENNEIAVIDTFETDVTTKKGDIVRVASNGEELEVYPSPFKTTAPYSLGGVFLGIGIASIFMRKRLEKQLENQII